jgi:hypothetical protein
VVGLAGSHRMEAINRGVKSAALTALSRFNIISWANRGVNRFLREGLADRRPRPSEESVRTSEA